MLPRFISSLGVCAGDLVCKSDVSDGAEISGTLAPCAVGTTEDVLEDVLRGQDIPDDFRLKICEVASGILGDWFMLRPQ